MLDATISNQNKKFEADIQKLSYNFDSKIQHQKLIQSAFEKKYSVTIIQRIQKIEEAVNRVTLEQGQISNV